MCVQLHGLISMAAERFAVLKNSMAMCFVYTALEPGQATSLSKETCFHVAVSQRVVRSQVKEAEQDQT